MTALVDDPARAAVVGRLGSRTVVLAGAGSGKTHTLVERVAAELGPGGLKPSELVVITFTERAARELVHRLRAAVPDVDIDEAYIGTIHGFCARVLRRYPIEAGLPPKFTAQGELTSASEAVDRAGAQVNLVFDAAAHEPALLEALEVLAAVAPLRGLAALAGAIDRQWVDIAGAALQPPSDATELQRRVAQCLAPLRDLVDDPAVRAASSTDKLAEFVVTDLATWLDDVPDTLVELARMPTVSAGGRGGKNFPGDAKQTRDLIKECSAKAGRVAVDEALRRVLVHLVPAVLADARTRLANGEVTFDDLLILCRRALVEHPPIVTELRRSIRQIYVDEFQDTDDVQSDIISRLCDPSPPGGSPAEPCVLFAVGDPKQAIYSFRNANPGLLGALAATAAASAQRFDLTSNFRSRADVCDWINAVMPLRFADQGAAAQAPYEALQATRAAAGEGDGPAVALLGVTSSGDGLGQVVHARSLDAAVAEAADIVATVRRATAPDGGWLVGPGKAAPARPATYGDVTILVRSRGPLPAIEDHLRAAEIPYRIEGGALLYESREVYELLRVLWAIERIDEPHRVVTALRTSVFGLSDPQLVEFQRAFRWWNAPTRARLDAAGAAGTLTPGIVAVVEALQSLQYWADHRHVRNPAQLLAEIYDRSFGAAAAHLSESAAASDTWRRVRFVIDEARAWVDETAGTLGEYLDWVATRVEAVDRSEIATDEREDAVRIMTIHAAKGLQFPIVIVAGLGRKDALAIGADAKAVAGPAGSTVEAKLRADVQTAGWVSRGRDDAGYAEDARLMYVAFTRAEDHLVVGLHTSAKSSPNSAARLAAAVCSRADVAVVAAEPADVAAPVPIDHPALAAVDEYTPLDFRAVDTELRRRVWTPSALAHELAAARPADREIRTDTDSDTDWDGDAADAPATAVARPWARYARDSADPGLRKDPANGQLQERSKGRYGTHIGTAVHETLQFVDLADPLAGLDARAAQAAANADVADAEAVATLARSIIASDLFAELARAARVRREIYVGSTIGEGAAAITVWGYLDALFERDGKLVVVDFKTDSAANDEAGLAERYGPQLSAYAAITARATGMEVSDAYLLVARRNGQPATEVRIPITPVAPPGSDPHGV